MTEKDFSGLNANLIHQLKKKIKELNEEKDKLKNIFDSVNDGIIIADIKTKKFYTGNKAICRMLGYSLDEIKNLSVLDIHRKKDLPYVLNQFKLQSMEELEIAKDLPVKRKDGSIFYADVNSSIVIIGGKSYIMGIFRDITERKRAEEALEEEKERYSQLFEQSNDAIFLLDFNGKIFGVNRRAEELAGYREKELLKMDIPQICPEQKHAKFGAMFKQGPERGGVRLESQLLTKGKDLRDIEVTAKVIKLKGFSFVQSIIRDITEQRKVEQLLKESEEKYEKLFEKTGDAIFIADPETGIIVDCNLAASKLVGREKSEIIGKHQRILHPPEEIKRGFSRTFKQHLAEKEGQILEAKVITKRGNIKNVEIRANLIEYGGKKKLQAIFRDITEKRRAEEKLIKQKERFEKEIKELKRELKKKNEF